MFSLGLIVLTSFDYTCMNEFTIKHDYIEVPGFTDFDLIILNFICCIL